MCLEATYVLCREHIAFSKFIKYACECGKNMTAENGAAYTMETLCYAGYPMQLHVSEHGSQAVFFSVEIR